MCIVCNVDAPDGVNEALAFDSDYRAAQQRMKKAAAALLKVMPHVIDPEQRRQYDRVHKRMKRLMREWNLIEHQRELKGQTNG